MTLSILSTQFRALKQQWGAGKTQQTGIWPTRDKSLSPSYEEALLLPSRAAPTAAKQALPPLSGRQNGVSTGVSPLRRAKSAGAILATAGSAPVAALQADGTKPAPAGPKYGFGFEPSPKLLGEITLACGRVKQRLGFGPTMGLQRAASLGGAGMSLCGLVMAMAGVPFGGLAIAGIGLSILVVCVLTGVIWNALERRRKMPAVKQDFKQTLQNLEAQLKAEGCPPNHETWLQLKRTLAMINGGFGYVAMEILRGTVLQIFVHIYEGVKQMVHFRAWRAAQQKSALASQSVA